jgi:hypothetical protein
MSGGHYTAYAREAAGKAGKGAGAAGAAGKGKGAGGESRDGSGGDDGGGGGVGGGWLSFNDAHVSRISGAQVCSPHAYVLFCYKASLSGTEDGKVGGGGGHRQRLRRQTLAMPQLWPQPTDLSEEAKLRVDSALSEISEGKE